MMVLLLRCCNLIKQHNGFCNIPGQIQSPLGSLAMISTFPYFIPLNDLNFAERIGFRVPYLPSRRHP